MVCEYRMEPNPIKLACLQLAASLLPNAQPADVLAAAQLFEAWLTGS